MALAASEEYLAMMDKQQKEVRSLVSEGLKQMKEGKIKDFNTVCDRLEKKYTNEAIQN